VETWLTGYTSPISGARNDVPVRIGDRVEAGLHVVQTVGAAERASGGVLVITRGRLLAHPAAATAHLGWSAYGSSLLIGPVETDGAGQS
jgi:hypothetical protein